MHIRQLQRALRRKLDAVESRKSHHVFYYMTVHCRDLRIAKFSHSMRGQLSNLVLSDTARRLRLRRSELDELVECSLNKSDILQRFEK